MGNISSHRRRRTAARSARPLPLLRVARRRRLRDDRSYHLARHVDPSHGVDSSRDRLADRSTRAAPVETRDGRGHRCLVLGRPHLVGAQRQPQPTPRNTWQLLAGNSFFAWMMLFLAAIAASALRRTLTAAETVPGQIRQL